MKVIIIHNAYPQYGGEDTVVANETAMLERHGCVVIPWTVPTKEFGIINLIRCGLSAAWNPFAARRLRSFLTIEQPDIAHFHNTFPLLSPSVFAACHHAGVPVVQTVHNYRHICPAGGFFRDGHVCEECIGKIFPAPVLRYGCYRNSRIASFVPAVSAYIQRVRRSFEQDVDTLIALNNFEREKLIQGGLPADRIVIKPNFSPDTAPRQTKGKQSGERFTICFAGRLSVDKGIDVLLHSWKKFTDALPNNTANKVLLRIAGSGELEGRVISATSESNSVQYLGNLSHQDTLSLVEKSDALICPSLWYEGMPMTILEALSKGTTVIASDIGGLPDMVEHEVNGLLFPPGDADQLANCFYKLYSSSQLTAQMSRSARTIFEERYTESVNFPLLQGIYQDTITRFRRSS